MKYHDQQRPPTQRIGGDLWKSNTTEENKTCNRLSTASWAFALFLFNEGVTAVFNIHIIICSSVVNVIVEDAHVLGVEMLM